MRYRVTFSKQGALRYIGHLDLHQVWERTIRRAGLPLAYTQGFHPGPKMQIAAALPLGFSGLAEIIDIWLQDAPEGGQGPRPPEASALEDYRARLQAAAPPGLNLLRLEPVDPHAPALQTQVSAAEYELTLLEGLDDPAGRVASLLAQPSLPRERRGKPYDLRPLIEDLHLEGESLSMTLAAREGATGRPEEVLDALGLPPEAARVTRKRLILRSVVQ